MPGGPISPVLDATMEEASVELVLCQHETTGLYAAGGYALATGQVGVVAVTSGPGILNSLSALAAARLDEIPVVVLVGEVATGSQGRGALQDGGAEGLDIKSVTTPLAKATLTLTHPDRASVIIDQAVEQARTAPMGPVVVRTPIDVLLAPAAEVQLATPTASPRVPARDAARAGALLTGASRPLILAGNGVRRSRASAQLVELAEWAQCPVATDLEAKGVFPESHPLSLGVFGAGGRGRAESYLAEPPDVVLAIGARLCDTTTGNHSTALVPPQATLIQVDHDSQRLARSYTPTLALVGDIPALIEGIASGVSLSPEQLFDRADRLDTVHERQVDRACHDGIDPVELASSLPDHLPSDAIYVCDIGNHLLFAAEGLALEHPDQFHASLGLGGMGSGLGAAIGMQLGYGSRRQVVAMVGDGTIAMYGNELLSCVRDQIPLTVVVFNDRQLGMVEHGSQQVYGRSPGWRAPDLDIAEWARSLGISSHRVRSLSDLMSVPESGGPRLLDVAISPTAKVFNPRDEILNFSSPSKAAG